jgi:hypothetical protein
MSRLGTFDCRESAIRMTVTLLAEKPSTDNSLLECCQIFIGCCSVVVFCHSVAASAKQFLFRAQDANMTNGDYVFFTFAPNVDTSVLQPWASWNLTVQDAAYRKTIFGSVKQVRRMLQHNL